MLVLVLRACCVAAARRGTWEPIKRIVDLEGGDSAALRASLNYMAKALALHQPGRTWRGRHWVAYNSWTLRYEFLYVKREYRETHSLSWMEREVQDNPRGAAPAASGVPAPHWRSCAQFCSCGCQGH